MLPHSVHASDPEHGATADDLPFASGRIIDLGNREDAPERAEAQKRAEECYDKMYERGYFRDSYNDSDLLWKFDLSWWDDVIPMLNGKSQLTPEKASALLSILKEKEPLFECALASQQEPARRYFRQKYTVFKEFLNQAIQLGVPIECSL